MKKLNKTIFVFKDGDKYIYFPGEIITEYKGLGKYIGIVDAKEFVKHQEEFKRYFENLIK